MSEDAPVQNARIFALAGDLLSSPAVVRTRPELLRLAAPCHTRSDGRFAIALERPGRVLLLAEKSGHAPSVSFVVVESGGTVDIGDLALEKGSTITGIVTDERRRPIVSARVAALDRASDPLLGYGDLELALLVNSFTRCVAITDGEGRFLIRDLPQGTYELIADGVVHVPARRSSIPSGARDVRITLERCGRLTGHVLAAADGRPIPRFEVTCWPVTGASRSSRPLRPLSRVEFRSPDGRFTLDEVDPGEVELVVSADGFAPASTGPLRVMRAPIPSTVSISLSLLDIETEGVERPVRPTLLPPLDEPIGTDASPSLLPTTPLTIQVVTEARLSSSGLSILLRHPGALEGRCLLPDDRGQVRTLVPIGDTEVALLARGRRVAVTRIEVIEADERTLEIQAPSGRIEGRITTIAGDPFPGATVFLRRLEGPLESDAPSSLEARLVEAFLSDEIAVTTDPFGIYRADLLPEGIWRIEALVPGHALGWRTLEVGDDAVLDADLELGPGGEIAGTVLEAGHTTGLPSCAVEAVDLRRGEIHTVFGDPRGGFVLPGLPEGWYRVMARAATGPGPSLRVKVTPGETVEVLLEADAPAATHGSLDSEGRSG